MLKKCLGISRLSLTFIGREVKEPASNYQSMALHLDQEPDFLDQLPGISASHTHSHSPREGVGFSVIQLVSCTHQVKGRKNAVTAQPNQSHKSLFFFIFYFFLQVLINLVILNSFFTICRKKNQDSRH